MDIYEISGFKTGIDRSGVNFLEPADAFENINNGYVYRQELKSRLGFTQFGDRVDDESRILGIFENVLPDGTRELLVASSDYLYTYNEGTNEFDQIPFAGAAGVFGITDKAAYISGTTYLTSTGSQRFVFTGLGMSDIFFYDGTDVKSFTDGADNPDYQAPALGPLTRATRVMWFGERLNFFVPVINGVTYNQGVLFSGIRDGTGNGDKFNAVGSGLLQADTYQNMKGALILGDVVIMNFQRSNWVLEKTRDAFNPYFIRQVPSVLGTDAGFSAVQWSYEVKSAGITGLITTDGRQSLKFDNKIPFYTRDNIEADNFDLIYGGFDREIEQFLFSYRDEQSQLASETQDMVLVYNYVEESWSVNTQRFSVYGQTDVGQLLTMSQIDETIKPSWERMDTTEETMNKIGLNSNTQKTLAGDDLGFVYQINQGFDDYFVALTNITEASSAVVTVSASAFQIGDRVIFENVEGMTEINDLIGTVTARTDTSLTVDINSTDFTTYTTAGTVSKTIDFQADMTVFNPYRSNGFRVYVSHLEILVNKEGGDVYLDIGEDDEGFNFKTVLIQPSVTSEKPRQWITATVNDEANFMNFRFRRESAVTQTIIPAFRIHCERGGLTSG